MTGIKSIILAGGSGTRLWPLSREMYPKQFLKFGKTSLFQETVFRCLEISDISEIFIVTNEAQKFFVIGQIEEIGHSIPPENVLIEPEARNTLPAIFFGMKEIETKFGNSIVGVFSSDHVLDRDAMKTISLAESLTFLISLLLLVLFRLSPIPDMAILKPLRFVDRAIRFRNLEKSQISKLRKNTLEKAVSGIAECFFSRQGFSLRK